MTISGDIIDEVLIFKFFVSLVKKNDYFNEVVKHSG